MTEDTPKILNLLTLGFMDNRNVELLQAIVKDLKQIKNELNELTESDRKMLSEDLQNFRDNMKQPWGRLYYRLVWAQLADIVDIKNLTILDFGSGFGTTANYLAKDNNVLAAEPNADIIEERERENNYVQIKGKVDRLDLLPDESFDVIICHNVLEFADERAEIVKELSRVLKSGGVLSIVKHNKVGKIMFKVIFDNNIDEAINLLDGGDSSNVFGKITY